MGFENFCFKTACEAANVSGCGIDGPKYPVGNPTCLFQKMLAMQGMAHILVMTYLSCYGTLEIVCVLLLLLSKHQKQKHTEGKTLMTGHNYMNAQMNGKCRFCKDL